MKSVTLATIALSALAGSLLQTTAEASPPTTGPRGRGCSYSASSDPSPAAGDDAMTGQVNAGPMIADAGGTLHCKIRVNVNNHAGGGVAADVSCPADSNGVIVCATTVDYTSGEYDQDYLCTSYQKPNGSWLYWHPSDDKGDLDPTNDEAGHWTANSNKPCSPATQISTGPIIDAIDAIDAILCIHLRKLSGPGPRNVYFIDTEGDVFVDLLLDNATHVPPDEAFERDWVQDLVWDCPYYTFPGTPSSNPDLNHNGEVVDWP